MIKRGCMCESYIVRIYRRDKKDPAGIIGLVEKVQTGEVEKFEDRDELFGVISRRPKERRRRAKGRIHAEGLP